MTVVFLRDRRWWRTLLMLAVVVLAATIVFVERHPRDEVGFVTLATFRDDPGIESQVLKSLDDAGITYIDQGSMLVSISVPANGRAAALAALSNLPTSVMSRIELSESGARTRFGVVELDGPGDVNTLKSIVEKTDHQSHSK